MDNFGFRWVGLVFDLISGLLRQNHSYTLCSSRFCITESVLLGKQMACLTVRNKISFSINCAHLITCFSMSIRVA